ncbi:CLUMA_CG010199, isoform A [Clunio marinus]|uniref:CLUMA_CG010199, isoform A n=1 Tax=Clunio marinus TaxID=568069 RepID=A0A1J1IAN4_9DIPT|nr:CLUMA_CG010199, isoform A [Clunio marinus]
MAENGNLRLLILQALCPILIVMINLRSQDDIKRNATRMTRRDPCLLQLKHGALLVLALIFAVTADWIGFQDRQYLENKKTISCKLVISIRHDKENSLERTKYSMRLTQHLHKRLIQNGENHGQRSVNLRRKLPNQTT